MRRLNLEETENTPYVNIDAESGVIELTGKSFPEDSIEFYDNIRTWIKDNFINPSLKIEANIKLDYFNTSTSKCLLKIFQLLAAKKKENNNEILINWFFDKDDEDMIEAGHAYGNITQLPFRLVTA